MQTVTTEISDVPNVVEASRPARLLNRNFVLLWQGQFVSWLGAQIVIIAQLFWIKRVTESASLIGIMEAVTALPALLFGPFGGVVADRFSRRKLIIFADVVRGVAALSLGAMMFLMPDAIGATIAWMFVVLLISSLMSAFFNPAISAAIPDLVPKKSITTANSLTQLSYQLTTFLGQGVGGALFRLLGAPVLFVIDGVTYLFSALSEVFVRIPQEIPETSPDWRKQVETLKEDLRAGFQYVWRRAGLRELVFVSSFLTFFTMPIIILMPFFVEDWLGMTPDWYGFMMASFGVGSLAGFLAAGSIKLTSRTRHRAIITILLAQSVGYGLIGMVREPMLVLVLAFAGGALNGFITVHITTMVQITTPTNIRGRVFGLLATISGGLAPISMGLAGIVADLINQNIPLMYMACGVAMVSLSLIIAFNRDFRHFVRSVDAGEDAAKVEERFVPISGQPSLLGRSTLSESVRRYITSDRLSNLLIAVTLGLVLGTLALVLTPLWALATVAGLLLVVLMISYG